MRHEPRIFILLMIPLLIGCGGFDNSQSETAPIVQTLANLEWRIQQTIRLECTTTAHCQVLASGNRPCGGPSRYFVYSTSSTNTGTLQQLSEEFTALERKYNLDNDVVGTCEFEVPPAVACHRQLCLKI